MPLLPNAIFCMTLLSNAVSIIRDTDIEMHVQNSERIEDTYKKEWCGCIVECACASGIAS